MALDPLSVVVGACVALLCVGLYRWVMHRRRGEAPQHAPQRVYDCTCGPSFYDDDEAKRHAVDTHNAPPQGDEWRNLFDVSETEVR